MAEEFDVGFEVIFNYGYDCCAFSHNICGSKPRIPAGLPDTSKSLSLKFFLSILDAPRVPSNDPNANIREEPPSESLPAVEEALII